MACSTDGATSYKSRKNALGNFVQIGTTTSLTFIDNRRCSQCGSIIPDLSYSYNVIAVKNNSKLATGLRPNLRHKGDNDRSDRVDGRDLYRLAQHFYRTTSDAGFVPLVDTTYDGVIGGVI